MILFSHPNKNYNTHIENTSKSFLDDKSHQEVCCFHDFAKQSDKFQTYILSDETLRVKIKTTHALESAYIYFFKTQKRDIEFLASFFSIQKHHQNLLNLHDMLDYCETIKVKLSDEKIQNIKTSLANSCKIKQDLTSEDCIYEFSDFFYDIKEDFIKICGIENFFIFKKRFSRLIIADKFEAIFNASYSNIPFLSKNICKEFISKIHCEIEKKLKNDYRNNAREVIFKNFENTIQKQNKFIIKAPTGIGKTYIALELALKIAQKKDKRCIITAIPFTSIIDQTCIEYEKILGNVLKYHHLTKYEAKESTKDEENQFSKKVFLADIWHEHFIVTTFNQLLNIFFSNSNKDNLRLETLRNSVVIIDEIQNISRFLLKDFAFVFNEFGERYDIDFIIMSATMPKIEHELENFTIISDESFYKTKTNRYKLVFDKNIKNFDDLSSCIKGQNKSVLCVVNTIAKAKTLYKNFTNDANAFLLTTHQIPKHRSIILKLIKRKLQQKQKITLIATQLIEAGVDLDFDIGFREFAPLPSIIQMAGRVNREGLKGISQVMVFSFLEVEKQDRELPYQDTDLQKEFVEKKLAQGVEEVEIFEILEQYFSQIKIETTHTKLKEKMENLEFEDLFNLFKDKFMPSLPWKVSLFIEKYENHFDDFIKKREEIFLQHKDNKFEALAKVKNLEKDLSKYTISVNEKLIKDSDVSSCIKESFGRFILKANSPFYTSKKGFDIDLTITEEAFS